MLDKRVDGLDFCRIVLSETLHDGFLIEGIVAGCRGIGLVGLVVAALGGGILLGVVEAVAGAIIGIGFERCAQIAVSCRIFEV